MSNHEAVRQLQREAVSRANLMDQLGFASVPNTTRAGFAVLDAIQKEQEGVQLLALAVMTLMYCKKYGVDPREVLGKAAAVIEDGLSENNQHLLATARFLKVHLKGDTQAFF